MSERAKDLAKRLKAFNNEVISFVGNCTDEDWRKTCAEDWPVGVVARHIGAGHYGAMGLAKMILSGEKLPAMTSEQITAMANQHARDHDGCTKAEVLKILEEGGKSAAEFAGSLEDVELDRTGHFGATVGKISTQQLIEMVILTSAGEHFANMKAAVGR